ncbi:hypothetical protein, partial [Ralstonia pseudosolanacearum]|uniref:hypothetical protein n=1 Tax=Ralstonia pseudosolanacearum TaxID=1310165 RepID=UPI001FF772A6
RRAAPRRAARGGAGRGGAGTDFYTPWGGNFVPPCSSPLMEREQEHKILRTYIYFICFIYCIWNFGSVQ